VDPAALERLVAQIGAEFLARLAPGTAPGRGGEGLNVPDEVCPGCVQRCAQTCHQKTTAIVEAGADRVSSSDRTGRVDPKIAALIDHTILRPDATAADVQKVCAEARRFGFASVCVNPCWVSLVARELAGSSVLTCSVIGFPFGATTTESKIAETGSVVRAGAREVDMVINIGALKGGDHGLVQRDIEAVAQVCHRGGAILKVIIETALLDDSEKATACTLAKLAGADFVKTSTGYAKHGATAHDIALMRTVVGPRMGVKAAGGVRTLDDLKQMTAAGASRIGASASVKIVEGSAS
jgi:deoxyribose-phosphate aldolase